MKGAFWADPETGQIRFDRLVKLVRLRDPRLVRSKG